MIRVRYVQDVPNDARPTVLPTNARAVLTVAYTHLDLDPGGATAEELHVEDAQALAVFPVGSDVLVESPDPADCLLDDEGAEQATRIWWRAVVVELARARISEDPNPFAMSVLRPTETGVNGAVIWVAVGGDDDPRIWVVVGHSLKLDELESLPVRLTSPPEVLGTLPDVVAQEVFVFIEGNRETLVAHWHGELDTREMIDLLRRVVS